MAGTRKAPGARRARPAAKANAARGEFELVLAGKTYCLRPSYAAQVAIEEALDQSMIELLRRANMCALQLGELGVVVGAYIRAGAEEADKITRAVADERIAELIYEEGVTAVYPVLTLLLAAAVTGGRTSSGEAKAVTETPTG